MDSDQYQKNLKILYDNQCYEDMHSFNCIDNLERDFGNFDSLIEWVLTLSWFTYALTIFSAIFVVWSLRSKSRFRVQALNQLQARVCLIFAYFIYIKFLVRRTWLCSSNKDDEVFLVGLIRGTFSMMGYDITVHGAAIGLFLAQYCQYWIFCYLYIMYYMLYSYYII